MTYGPYNDAHAGAVIAIRSAVYPDLAGPVEEWRQCEAEFDEAKHPRRRCVALDAGEVIGYACAWNTLAPRKYRVDVMVRPDRQRQGVGGRLLEQMLEEVRALGGISLQSRAGDDQPEILAFLERHGFRAGTVEVRLVRRLAEMWARLAGLAEP